MPNFPILAKVDQIIVSNEAVKRQITHIIIHHSATFEGNAESFDRYHREFRGWKAIGYHFVVGNGKGSPEGVIELGRDLDNDQDVLEETGAHTLGFNRHTVGICGVGNFDETLPDPLNPQIRSIGLLVARLMHILNIPVHKVLGHREAGTVEGVPPVLKTCPGARVDCNDMRNYFFSIQKYWYAGFAHGYNDLVLKLRDENPELNIYGGP